MKRLLFVDDEPNVLHGLRRMFYPYRNEWELVFANSAEDALSTMEQGRFDVVVSDMRMPGMNGAELLTRCKDLYPSTVRVVLSGHADAEASMCSVAVSHQFLAKPCDPGRLRETVERACNLQALLDGACVRSRLGSVAGIPVAPTVYRELTRLLAQDDVNIDEIADVVQRDLGLSTRILQLVNSSYFGIRREIFDLSQATAYVGVNTIRDLALTFGAFEQFHERVSSATVTREQNHAIATAQIAKHLLAGQADADQAFLAGMLHDVGKLVLATNPELAGRSLDNDLENVDTLEGVGHGILGGYLLGLWGLSYSIVEAVAFHDKPGSFPGTRSFGLLAATHVADVLASEIEAGTHLTEELDEEFLDDIGVLPEIPEWRRLASDLLGEPSASPGGEL